MWLLEKKRSTSKKLPVENSINEHIFRNIRDKTSFLVLCKIHTKMVSVCLKIKCSKIHPVIYQLHLLRISSNVACYGLDEVLHIVDGLFLGVLCIRSVLGVKVYVLNLLSGTAEAGTETND